MPHPLQVKACMMFSQPGNINVMEATVSIPYGLFLHCGFRVHAIDNNARSYNFQCEVTDTIFLPCSYGSVRRLFCSIHIYTVSVKVAVK